MEKYKFTEITKIICDRICQITVSANSYEEALSKIKDGIDSTPKGDIPDEGDIEITDCYYRFDDYEVVSEAVETFYGGKDETVLYEKRINI